MAEGDTQIPHRIRSNPHGIQANPHGFSLIPAIISEIPTAICSRKKGKPQILADKRRSDLAFSAKSAALHVLPYGVTVRTNSSPSTTAI